MTSRLRRCALVCAYYSAWGYFFVVGTAFNLCCLPLLLVPRRQQHGPRFRGIVRWLFAGWMHWLRLTRATLVEWQGFDAAPLPAGTIYVANHPCLVDALVLLSRLPNAICIFKPSLVSNPAVGPAAVLGGYVRSRGGIELVREAAQQVAAGCSLLVFPEGTRTAVGQTVGPLHRGFALIAAQARAPVQLVVIRTSPGLVRRGLPWWRPPTVLPGRVVLTLDRCWPHDPQRSAAALTEQVQARISEALGSTTA